MNPQLSLGVDFGTNSVRALLVDVSTGHEVASATAYYERGDAGVLLDPADPNVARQSPTDYVEGFISAVSSAVATAKSLGLAPSEIAGIGIDATGSTPLPITSEGIPL